MSYNVQHITIKIKKSFPTTLTSIAKEPKGPDSARITMMRNKDPMCTPLIWLA